MTLIFQWENTLFAIVSQESNQVEGISVFLIMYQFITYSITQIQFHYRHIYNLKCIFLSNFFSLQLVFGILLPNVQQNKYFAKKV